MSVSRDFIDSCSPEAPATASNRRGRPPTQASVRRGRTVSTQPSALRNVLISLPKTHCCFLTSAARTELPLAPACGPIERLGPRTAARRFLTWCLPSNEQKCPYHRHCSDQPTFLANDELKS